MSNINWAKLYNEGRVKAVGVAWNAEESEAIHVHKIPVEYVRDGVLTLEAYTKVLEKEAEEGRPLHRWAMAELASKAEQLGIEFTPDATEDVLVKLINQELVKRAEQTEADYQVKKQAEAQLSVEEARAAKKAEKEAEKAAKEAAKKAEKEAAGKEKETK